MPGYTHVCDACGATIEVHERYVGRTLRCTSCGTAFLADPILAAAVRRARQEAIARRRRVVRRRWGLRLGIAVGAALVALLLWWLGRPAGDIGLDHTPLFYGQIVEVEGPGQRLAAIDRSVIGALVEAAESGDQAALDELAARPDVIEVGAGTRLQVIEVRKRDHALTVRALNGVWAGRKILIPVVSVR